MTTAWRRKRERLIEEILDAKYEAEEAERDGDPTRRAEARAAQDRASFNYYRHVFPR